MSVRRTRQELDVEISRLYQRRRDLALELARLEPQARRVRDLLLEQSRLTELISVLNRESPSD